MFERYQKENIQSSTKNIISSNVVLLIRERNFIFSCFLFFFPISLRSCITEGKSFLQNIEFFSGGLPILIASIAKFSKKHSKKSTLYMIIQKNRLDVSHQKFNFRGLVNKKLINFCRNLDTKKNARVLIKYT